MLKVLLVIPDPLDSDLPLLDSREEWQSIARTINYQGVDVNIRIIPPTLEHLRFTLIRNTEHFDIIHFIGHGDKRGIVLEDKYSSESYITADELASTLIEGDTELVILNICESEGPAEALVDAGIRAVIATTASIPDRYAIAFAEELYGALTAGKSVAEAVSFAQVGLHRIGGQTAAQLPTVLGDDRLKLPLTSKSISGTASVKATYPKNNLRHQAQFIGRRRELLRSIGFLSDANIRAIEITGLGGIGKTALGLEVARRCAWRFMGGIIWIEGFPASDPFHIWLCRAINDVLPIQMTDSPDRDVQAALQTFNEQQCLLIFDDPDRLTDATKSELCGFLKRLSGTSKAILLTRTHMSGLDEIDGIGRVNLGSFEPDEGLRFLLRETEARAIDEIASNSELAVSRLIGIAEQVGYHPKMMQLAVGLIGKRGFGEATRILSQLPENIVGKIESLLSEALGTLQARDVQTLRAMATFVSPFDSERLTQVGGSEVSHSLDTLIDSNLVERDSWTGCYRLHALVRDYALHNQWCKLKSS